jgi:hypothetical protein
MVLSITSLESVQAERHTLSRLRRLHAMRRPGRNLLLRWPPSQDQLLLANIANTHSSCTRGALDLAIFVASRVRVLLNPA